MNTTIRRGIVAAAVAFPIALGTAGVAAADTGYDSGSSHAGPGGTSTSQTSAGTNGQGSSFDHSSGWAGKDGASHQSTKANADQGSGSSSFEHQGDWAGADGASSSHTSSHAGGNTDTDNGQGVMSGMLSGIGL